MNALASATQLRQRARHLRQLATAIETSPVMRLDRYGDVDTWRGARSELCRLTLERNQHQLHAAAEDLREQAWRFDREADELDAITHTRIAAAG
jgi:hypothetical protein